MYSSKDNHYRENDVVVRDMHVQGTGLFTETVTCWRSRRFGIVPLAVDA